MDKRGFTPIQQRQQKLNAKKDLLTHLNEIVPWEEFRALLEEMFDKPRKSNAGRKAFDVLLLFKMLVLQHLYNLSDEELEYQVNDRLSFMQFLGLSIEDVVPDATTVWLFRERLRKQGGVEALFERFDEYLNTHGYQAKGGQILDATLIPVPKQHFNKEEKAELEQGERPESWQDKPHRSAQKDTDARWTKKNGSRYFGYKDHINIDVEYELIRAYAVTDAAVHDSQLLGHLLDEDNESDDLWADSAYRSVNFEWVLALLGFYSRIHERAYRNRPLSEQQKQANRERSKIRAKVEHVFGDWVMSMGGKLVRSIGIERAKATLGLKNLVYNLKRYVFLETKAALQP